MQTRRTRIASAAAATTVALMTLSTPSIAARSARQRAIAPATAPIWDTFQADLTIRHAIIRADGQPLGPAAPASTVRLERRESGGRWRTTMTLVNIERPEIRGLAPGPALDNPFQAVRLEYDEDGTPPRMYDRQGRLVRLPRAEDRRLLHTPATLAAGLPAVGSPAAVIGPPPAALVGRSWVDAVLAPPGLRLARRAALERQLGRQVGQVRGLDRFLAFAGDLTHEVLVDPATTVAVEINTTRRGELVARTTLVQLRDAADVLVSRTSRTERALPGEHGERSVTTTELTNIRLTAGGAR